MNLKRTVVGVMVGLVVGASGSVMADAGATAERLRRQCEFFLQRTTNAALSIDENLDALACYNYVVGFQEGSLASSIVLATQRYGEKTTRNNVAAVSLYCPPQGTNVDDLIRSFVAYLVRYPSESKLVASVVLLNAFAKSYPCK